MTFIDSTCVTSRTRPSPFSACNIEKWVWPGDKATIFVPSVSLPARKDLQSEDKLEVPNRRRGKKNQTAAILNITMNPTGKGKSEHFGCKMINY